MMDLLGDAPTLQQSPRARQFRLTPKRADLVIDSGGLFDLKNVLSAQRFRAIFHSGASAFYDALGLTRTKKDVGTVAGELSPSCIGLLRHYVAGGGKHFCDSGAFGRFQEWKDGKTDSPKMDFESVLAIYDRLVQDMDEKALCNLSLVMPDVVGNPEWSLALLQQYRQRILGYIAKNVDVIVPIQKSDVPAGETANRVFAILGTRQVTLGIPSKAAAMHPSDVATIRHDRIHVLGRASMTIELYSRVYAFTENNPYATVSCDGNKLRGHLPRVTFEHKRLIAENDGNQWQGEFDDTELVHDVINTPAWLRPGQVKAIANAYGIHSRREVSNWRDAHLHHVDGLRDLIEAVDPDCSLLMAYVIPAVFDQKARQHLSARLRAQAVAMTFSD